MLRVTKETFVMLGIDPDNPDRMLIQNKETGQIHSIRFVVVDYTLNEEEEEEEEEESYE